MFKYLTKRNSVYVFSYLVILNWVWQEIWYQPIQWKDNIHKNLCSKCLGFGLGGRLRLKDFLMTIQALYNFCNVSNVFAWKSLEYNLRTTSILEKTLKLSSDKIWILKWSFISIKWNLRSILRRKDKGDRSIRVWITKDPLNDAWRY